MNDGVLRGNTRILLDVNKVKPGYPWYVIMALPATLKNRPQDVIKLLRAHQKAIEFIYQHPEEADKVIADAFKLQGVTDAQGKHYSPAEVVREARKRIHWSASLTESDKVLFIS